MWENRDLIIDSYKALKRHVITAQDEHSGNLMRPGHGSEKDASRCLRTLWVYREDQAAGVGHNILRLSRYYW